MFKEYSKIENIHHATKVRDQIDVFNKEWCVIEKSHGCNFQFQTNNGIEIIAGKRHSLINEQELKTFHHCEEVIEKYKSYIIKLYNLLQPKQNLIVYGELCGGSYPPFKNKYKPVQQEVFYCPNIEFLAFDIYLDNQYLPPKFTEPLFLEIGLPYLKSDFKGTFDEVVIYSKTTNKSLTSIPTTLFGLQSIPDNIREGNIIKPYSDILYFKNGSRAIFKDKNEYFVEKTLEPKEKKQIDKNIDGVDELKQYLVLPRWNGIISKEGDISNKNKLVCLFINDAMEDYYKDHEDIHHTKEQKKYLKNAVFKFALTFAT